MSPQDWSLQLDPTKIHTVVTSLNERSAFLSYTISLLANFPKQPKAPTWYLTSPFHYQKPNSIGDWWATQADHRVPLFHSCESKVLTILNKHNARVASYVTICISFSWHQFFRTILTYDAIAIFLEQLAISAWFLLLLIWICFITFFFTWLKKWKIGNLNKKKIGHLVWTASLAVHVTPRDLISDDQL